MATRTWIIGGTVVVAVLAIGGWFALGGNAGGASIMTSPWPDAAAWHADADAERKWLAGEDVFRTLPVAIKRPSQLDAALSAIAHDLRGA